MSSQEMERPFESIESAYDFMNVLADAIMESIKDLHEDHTAAIREGQPRTAQAIELALFKARTLNCYVHKSRRTLNDLRTLRRLILNERMVPEVAGAGAQYR
jgi:hypothetical protein